MNRHMSTGRKAILVGGILAMFAGRGTQAATIWSVSGSNPACSDLGAGDSTSPFCTIQAAANKALPGDTVSVSPGTYPEQVTPKFSGSPGAPIVYMAAGAGVVVQGTTDVSVPASWLQASATAWSLPLNAVTRQVTVDGLKLSAAASATTTTPNSFYYDAVAKLLYVDIGGANPAQGHTVLASIRSYAFNVAGLSNIVLDGFAVTGQNTAGVRTFNAASTQILNIQSTDSAGYGVRVEASSGPVTIQGCSVSFAASNGILLLNTSGTTVRGNRSNNNGFHGISLQGSSSNLVTGNTCFANAKPNVRSAVGIDINAASSNNQIQNNTTYANQDSGIQVYNGSNNNVVTRNVSYNNGDHGFDTNKSTGTRYISNTSYGNFKDGFSVEGASTGTILANNISVNNGLTTVEFDLYVDTLSTNGFFSDFDLFYNAGAASPVKFNGTVFGSLAAFKSATPFEVHGMSTDPAFVDAASGDFRLSSSSPLLNQAYCVDCGASETILSNVVVSLAAAPASGYQDLPVTATATAGNIDPSRVTGYTFNFGDGTVIGPQSSPVANHTFTTQGIFVVTSTVCDISGLCASDSNLVFVLDTPPNAALSLSASVTSTGKAVQADASASFDTDGSPIASYSFNFGDGFLVGPQTSPLSNHVYTAAGTYTVIVTVTDTAGVSSSASRTVNVWKNNAPTAILNLTPKIASPFQIVTADASRSTDTDPAPIASYTFNFGDGFVAGPQASPIARHAFAAKGHYDVTVTVTDTAGLSSTDSIRVMVKR